MANGSPDTGVSIPRDASLPAGVASQSSRGTENRGIANKGVAKAEGPETKRQTLTPPSPLGIRFYFVPKMYEDKAIILARHQAARWKNMRYAVHVDIVLLDDIFQTFKDLLVMGYNPPFVSEVYIAAHGLPGQLILQGTDVSVSSQNRYSIDTLKDEKRFGFGRGERYMMPNADIILMGGCRTAVGIEGKQFLHRLGQVFFGNKKGYLQGATGNTNATVGGPNPVSNIVRYEYPGMVEVKPKRLPTF